MKTKITTNPSECTAFKKKHRPENPPSQELVTALKVLDFLELFVLFLGQAKNEKRRTLSSSISERL